VASVLLLDPRERITGRPQVAAATDPPDDGRAGAEAAVLAVTTLLDEARRQPLAALKKGGVGTRERVRLAKLGVPEPALAIDVAFEAGLLAPARPGYGASGDYDAWRADDLPSRWARIAMTWFALEVAPTCRETDDGEVPPPLPIASSSGLLRRAVLRAASGGASVRSVREHIEWFCPLHGYEPRHRDSRVTAAVREAELLGVVAGDRLSALGEALVVARSEAELAGAVQGLLPETRGMLVLQSDLTALVSGQVSAAAARLLSACAVAESRGVAVTWRFTPASVRSALDDGWSVEELRAELAAVSDRELPQPLDYLLGDVARRHGSVRVREVRSCITGTEAELTEIRHTRSLAKLQLRALAPTVLAGPCEIGEVITKLRAAGFSPMAEDADGVVVVPERKSGPVARARKAATPRASVDPVDLAVRLLATPAGALLLNGTHAELTRLAARLDAAEVALLADALEHGRDVRIRYRNKDGNHSVRTIRPQELWDRWLTSWCHLRGAERDFSVAGIESVGLPD
jgi:Helicase conserved C-terminal domain